MSKLCQTFIRQAIWTWKTLDRAWTWDANLGEESLTDFNLLEVIEGHRGEVLTKTFSKRKEAKKGGDWEWWFIGPNGISIGFRIQAKILDKNTGRFEHLHYGSKKKGYQSDILCDRAKLVRGLIPLYCLYTSGQMPPRTSQRHLCFPYPDELYGCSLVDAFLIPQLRTKNEKRLVSIFPNMVPWHCLVCCNPDGNSDELPLRAFAFWNERIRKKGIDREQFLAKPTKELPYYVRHLLEGKLVEPPDADLRSVTIFRDLSR